MAEMHISHYLDQILFTLDELEEVSTQEESREIAVIKKRVETYRIGIQRVNTRQMVMCILAGLEEIKPQIERLIISGQNRTPTWPAPPESGERISQTITGIGEAKEF